jgi:glutaredoxin
MFSHGFVSSDETCPRLRRGNPFGQVSSNVVARLGCATFSQPRRSWGITRATLPDPERTMSKLSLYYYPACPFCRRVTHVIDDLPVDIELRDTRKNPDHQTDLLAARGRGTVPVLRIENDGEPDVWMPESRDIIRYLQKNFGDGETKAGLKDTIASWLS